MKKELTEDQINIFQKIKTLIMKYDANQFTEKMIFIEESPFSELKTLMNEIGDGQSLIPKTKSFTKKLLKEWDKLQKSLNEANEQRIEEAQAKIRSTTGFEFSSISILYGMECKFFRETLNEYVEYVEIKYKSELSRLVLH
ncbi:hypothetical protein ND860_18095 [Leptospira levettii]|uniref:hypothetical protein n=1 Tax=Leptospira levettii TaxID=2023178 RepID=UPI00223DA767|nr:hypothetical protein [Leptospira levettii]MCW7498453.1 hypothetical protein [Leptospira levettii]